MRGSKAKRIRAVALRVAGDKASSVAATYAPKPGTGRKKRWPIGFQFDADGKLVKDEKGQPVMKFIEYLTVTHQLAPDCRRFYTQRLKRFVKRNPQQEIRA